VSEVGTTTEGAGRVTIEVTTVPVNTGNVSTVEATTDGRDVTVSTGMGTGASPVETTTVGVGTAIDVPWAEVGAGAAADDDAGFWSPYATASKTPLGILAEARSCEKVPRSSWYENELVLLAGVATARDPLAQASVTAPLGFRDPEAHWLQPLQSTSSCQCEALAVVDGKTV